MSEEHLRQILEVNQDVILDYRGWRVIAENWEEGLLYWYLSARKHGPDDPEPMEVYEEDILHPVEGPMFRLMVLDAVEREDGRIPPMTEMVEESGELKEGVTEEEFSKDLLSYMHRSNIIRVEKPEIETASSASEG